MYFESAKVDIIAPGLIEQTWSEAEVLGSATWLWMHSKMHRILPLHTLQALLLPAIKHRQFILALEQGQPVFYMAWANLNPEAEQRYLQHHAVHMQDGDWNSGDRGWILDWVAPFGHTRRISRLLEQQLFANRCMRYLYHRGDERNSQGQKRGLAIKQFRGRARLPLESKQWFDGHPIVKPIPSSQSDRERT